MSLSDLDRWEPSTPVAMAEERISGTGGHVLSNSARTTGAIWDLAEASQWTPSGTAGKQPSDWLIAYTGPFEANQVYMQGDAVNWFGDWYVMTTGPAYLSTANFQNDLMAGHWSALSQIASQTVTPLVAPVPPSITGGVTVFPIANAAALPGITGQNPGDIARDAAGNSWEWDGSAWKPMDATGPTVYTPANVAALGALTGMQAGDLARVTGPPVTNWEYNGTEWVPQDASSSTAPQTFTVTTNGQTNFTLPSAPADPTHLHMTYGNVAKRYGDHFTIAGTALTLTFPSVPIFAGDQFELY